MKAVIFLARICFLFNILFLFLFAGYMGWFKTGQQAFDGFVVTGGTLAIIISAIFFITLVVRLFLGKSNNMIPRWLLAFNFFVYMLEIIFYFI